MVVSEIAPQTAFPGDTVAVDVSTAFRDPDGDALTFTAVASDSSVVGVSVSESHVTMVGLSRGSAVVTVTARDPHGAEAGQSFEVTVPNRVPAVAEAIGPRTVFLGESAVVDLSGRRRAR
ncbi:Ig-like domain-containing protein [Candidatus Palauibacter sp.]|uniref:Ig-like domain-containing protein n=1 Tax=Candidatus Palauibacter sp. TaxID=3101350 RepID=UPI003B5CA3AD